MKLFTEYLEHALDFERIAAEEPDSTVKAALEKQAAAYRKLAVERVTKLGLSELTAQEKFTLRGPHPG